MLTEINNLNAVEFKRLADFINSPYHNKSVILRRLFSYICKFYPEIKKEHVTHKELSLNVYRESKINPEKIRKLISGFNKLIEKFILTEEINSDVTGNRLLLIKAARKRFLKDLSDKRLYEFKKMKLKAFGKDEMMYFNKMIFYDELFISSFPLKNSRSHYYSGKKIFYLNFYFIYQTLVFNYNFHSDKITKTPAPKLKSDLTDEVFRFVENNFRRITGRFPDIITLYYANRMIITGNIIFYNRLVKYFNSNRHKFDHNLRTMYFLVCENFFKIKNSVSQDRQTKKRLFELRSEILRNKHFEMFFTEGRVIPSAIFFSIFNDAVNLKEFVWAEKFISETKKFLPVNEKDHALNAVMMILNFFKGETDEVFKLLNRTNKNHTRQFIYSRYIKMMILYETDSMQELHYESEAFRKYLTRKENSGTTAKQLVGKSFIFLKCMNRLAKLKSLSMSSVRSKLLKFENNYYKNYKSPEYEFWFDRNIDQLISRKK